MKAELTENQKSVIAVLTAKPEVNTTSKIAEATKINVKTLYAVMTSLCELKLIEKAEVGLLITYNIVEATASTKKEKQAAEAAEKAAKAAIAKEEAPAKKEKAAKEPKAPKEKAAKKEKVE